MSAGLALLAAAACRGAADLPAGSTPLSVEGSPAVTPARAASPAPSASSNSASAAPAPSGPRCRTEQLTLRFAGAQAAAETVFLSFQLANRGDTPCLIQGYVGLRMLDAAGRALTTRPVPNGGVFANQPPPTAFLLRPLAGGGLAAAAASFQVAFTQVRKPGAPGCPAAYQLEVTPPDEQTPLVVPVQDWPLAPCNSGELDVAPLRPPGVASQ